MLNLDIPYLDVFRRHWELDLIQALLLGAYGAAAVWLTYVACRAHERFERKKTALTTQQRIMVPESFAVVPGYDLAAISQPAQMEQEVGGDFYDFYPMGAGTYGLLIGDVRRRGTDAAASAALLRYSTRALSGTAAGPAEVLRQLNELIESQVNANMREQVRPFGTASLFFGVLHARTGTLRYANAGQEPPLLRQSGGTEQVLTATGPILGIGPGQVYEERLTALATGDALLLLTDSVTAARNGQAEVLGSDGVWRMLRPALLMPTTCMALSWLKAALAEFMGRTQCADITMVLLRREATEDSLKPIAEETRETPKASRLAASPAPRFPTPQPVTAASRYVRSTTGK